MLMHNHHIIPKHAGGTDEPGNFIQLTIPEHAEAHRLLYEQYGRLGDKCAWLMLSGRTDAGELLIQELSRRAPRSAEARTRMSLAKRGNTDWTGRKHTCETRAKQSKANRGVYSLRNIAQICPLPKWGISIFLVTNIHQNQ